MNDKELLDRPKGVLIMAAVNAAVAVTFAVRLPRGIDGFREMFKSFGVELGTSTKLVLAAPYLWVLYGLVASALLIWVGAKARVTAAELWLMRAGVRGFIVVFGLSLAFAFWALYQPIFKMGQAV